MKHLLVLAAAAAVAFASTASAMPGSQAVQHRAQAQVSPETTGSVARAPVWAQNVRDLQGRDFRSSTRGNAEFPERAPEAQNLGNTAGGSAF